SNARPTARRRSRTRASSRKPCANKAGMSSSKAWDNSALALWMASRYLGSMATSPGNGGEGRDWFCLKRRCHDSGRKKSTYQRSLITPPRNGYPRNVTGCEFYRMPKSAHHQGVADIIFSGFPVLCGPVDLLAVNAIEERKLI